MALTADILIVEDDELIRELLKRRLEVDNHNITTVSTGADALKIISDHKFDLVLLDIMLPDINGVEVLEKIRKYSDNDSIKIMMVTANNDREMVLHCLNMGANDYLIKPFSMLIVKARIQRNIENASVTQQPLVSAKILLVDDQELNRDVLAHRLSKSGYDITSANNGEEALSILENNVFDLILLDIMMPNISGIDVLKQIRMSTKHHNTPIIMVTALDDIETVNECIEAGANDYLTKPINTVLLKLRISSCLQSRQVHLNSNT